MEDFTERIGDSGIYDTDTEHVGTKEPKYVNESAENGSISPELKSDSKVSNDNIESSPSAKISTIEIEQEPAETESEEDLESGFESEKKDIFHVENNKEISSGIKSNSSTDIWSDAKDQLSNSTTTDSSSNSNIDSKQSLSTDRSVSFQTCGEKIEESDSLENIAGLILDQVLTEVREKIENEASNLVESVLNCAEVEAEEDQVDKSLNYKLQEKSITPEISQTIKRDFTTETDTDSLAEVEEFAEKIIADLEHQINSLDSNTIMDDYDLNDLKKDSESINLQVQIGVVEEGEGSEMNDSLIPNCNDTTDQDEILSDDGSFADENEDDYDEDLNRSPIAPPLPPIGPISQEGYGSGRTSQNSGGRRSSLYARGISIEQYSEDNTIVDYLYDMIPVQEGAEARLLARRQARAEAREIRMKELEKQQKESEENADRSYDMYSTDVVNRAAFRVALGSGSHRAQSSVSSASYHSSRRSSEDSSEDGIINIRDLRHEMKELEEKFRKSMIQNAQQDNEKSALTYNVELLKDKIEDLEEALTQLQRDHRDKCRDFEQLKRIQEKLKDDLEYLKFLLVEKDTLIKDYGLVVVESEVEVDIGNGEKETQIQKSLVTQQSANILNSLGRGSLDVRLNRILEEKNELVDENTRLKIELEEERNKNYPNKMSNNVGNHMNGPEGEYIDEIQREMSKQMAEYKYKVQKYEQEIATLQANVARLDSQVFRYKQSSEEAESREEDLKVEKRKLQREYREAQSKLDELETTNTHLQKRLDKLKTAKSNLLKDL